MIHPDSNLKNINFRIEGAKFMKMYGLQMASRDQQG
jgi:hypothetical protein